LARCDYIIGNLSLTKELLVFSSSFQKFTITKSRTMSLFNTGKNKKDKKKGNLPQSKSTFISPKGGGKANTKTASNAGKHVGGAQRGA
jgi:hypothetical protein